MNKFFILALITFSFSLAAQETVDLNEPAVSTEAAPIEAAATEAVVENAQETPTEASEEEKTEEVTTAAEEVQSATPVEETPAPEIVTAPPVAVPAPVVTSTASVDEEEGFNPRRSHWMTSFGFEAMEYQLPFSYSGVKENFSEEKRQLYGGRLGFGGEVHLGAGFLIGAMLEGYYMGTLFEKAKTADPEIDDLDVAATKDEGQIYGGDLVATLSFLWDFKTKNPFMDEWAYLFVEPFVEAGIGRAWAYNKKDYFYDTGSGSGVQEAYDHSFTDELTNARIGGGLKLTSRTGFYLYLRATQNRYDITRRRQKGFSQQDDAGQTPLTGVLEDSKMDPVMIYSLGGGYRF
jgi:hypothetical protein